MNISFLAYKFSKKAKNVKLKAKSIIQNLKFFIQDIIFNELGACYSRVNNKLITANRDPLTENIYLMLTTIHYSLTTN